MGGLIAGAGGGGGCTDAHIDNFFNLKEGKSILTGGTYFGHRQEVNCLNTDMKMFRRADAYNSLNIITSQQKIFSLQSNYKLTMLPILL